MGTFDSLHLDLLCESYRQSCFLSVFLEKQLMGFQFLNAVFTIFQIFFKSLSLLTQTILPLGL